MKPLLLFKQCSCAFALLASVVSAGAQANVFFNVTNNGDFAVAANWNTGALPTGFGNTWIGSSALGSPILATATAYLTTDVTSLSTGTLWLGQGSTGNGTLTISNGGSLQYGLVYIGRDSGAVGTLNQLGGTNRVNTGTFEIQSGGTSGTYNLSGGVLNTIVGGAMAIKVGTSGSGTGYFNMSGGTFNAGTNFATQQHSLNTGWGAKGEAMFSAGTANLTGDLNAGNGSNGLVTISGTALVNARSVNVGLNAGAANSRLTVSGGTLSVTNGISVSNSSVLNVSGGTVTAAGVRISTGSVMTNSGGTLSIPAITNNGTLTFARGDTLAFSGAISGSGTTTVTSGILSLASGGRLSTATTVTNTAVLRLDSGGAWTGGEISIHTNGVVRFNGGTGTNTASLNAYGGTVDVNGQSLLAGSFANFIAREPGAKLMNSSTNAATIASGNNTVWLFTASAEIETVGNLQIDSSIISFAAPSPTGITKTGAGTLTLTASNTFTGAVAVNAGLLNLNSSSGGAAGSANGVTAATGATLLISQSGQVNDSADVTLSGGTIQRGSGVSEVFGNLNITAASFLNFGSGTTGNLQFQSYTNTGSALVTVQSFFQGNSLQFASATFNAGNLAQFSFDNGYTTSIQGDYFTITAIPEASTILAALGLAGLMLWPVRRRVFRAGGWTNGVVRSSCRASRRECLPPRASEAPAKPTQTGGD